jgi:hypothetical protein
MEWDWRVTSGQDLENWQQTSPVLDAIKHQLYELLYAMEVVERGY